MIGHELPRRQDRVEHGMASGLDVEYRLGDDFRSAIALPRCELGQRAQDVKLREDRAGLNQTRSLSRDPVAQSREELILQLAGPVLGTEDPFFVLLQLRGDVALGVLDGLLTYVIAR